MNSEFSASLRIAIVEDEARLRDLLVREIGEMGHTAEGFRSAEEGWPQIEKGGFDLVLLDLNLPGIGGMELFAKIRNAKIDIRVVILTGYGEMGSAVQALRWGAVDYLTKPCGLDDIERVLSKVLVQKSNEHREGLLGGQEVAQTSAPASFEPPPQDADGHTPTLEELEREHILKVLQLHNGNKRAAARELGVSLRTIYNKLQIYEKQDSPNEQTPL